MFASTKVSFAFFVPIAWSDPRWPPLWLYVSTLTSVLVHTFKIKELLAKVPKDHVSKPILKARLSDKQWDNVKYINQALTQEYECRREMLLKRLDVTIQSFKWSDRAKVSGKLPSRLTLSLVKILISCPPTNCSFASKASPDASQTFAPQLQS